MANHRRGEIEAVLDGRPRVMVLTLGALAELEAAFGAEDIIALAGRFGAGRLSARDLTRIIGAGLRGAGEAVTDAEVSAMRAESGAAGFAEIAVRLLAATFGAETEGGHPPPDHSGWADANINRGAAETARTPRDRAAEVAQSPFLGRR